LLLEFRHGLGLQAGIWAQRGRRREPVYLDPLGADSTKPLSGRRIRNSRHPM